MTFHIDYDREENKIELILDSQCSVIRTLAFHDNDNFKTQTLSQIQPYFETLSFH